MSRWFTATTAICLLLPGLLSAADEKSNSSSSTKPDSAKEKLLPAGQILGEIIKMEQGGKSFTLRMHQRVPQLSYSGGLRPGGGCSS